MDFSCPIVAALALFHRVFVVLLVIRAGPMADALEDRDDGCAFFREAVFDARRDLVVLLTRDHAVVLQLLERGGEDGVRDVRHFLPQLAVAHGCCGGEYAEDARVPFAAKDFKAVFERAADVIGEFLLIHDVHLLALMIASKAAFFKSL